MRQLDPDKTFLMIFSWSIEDLIFKNNSSQIILTIPIIVIHTLKTTWGIHYFLLWKITAV